MYNVTSLKKTHINKEKDQKQSIHMLSVCLIMNGFYFIMLIFPIAFRIFKYIHNIP